MSQHQRAAIYCRVSTDQQVDGTSLTSQRSQCVDFAATAGWTVTEIVTDEGVSGAIANRPALDRLLALCDQRMVDVVVVAKLDRLGRSLRHLAALIGRLDDAGISLVSVTDGFDSRTANGRLHRDILGSFAEFEREVLLERITGGLRARVREGWWPGGPPPYGYRLVRDGRHHRLEVDETEARAIRTAVAVLVDEGGTTSDAARTLNALGYLPRQAPRWRYNHLRRFLLGAQLTGGWLYGRKASEFRHRPDGSENQHVELRIPPILTPERQLALFERLEASRIPRQRQHPPRFYLLGGGRITSPCGQHFQGVTTNTRRRKYHCPGRRLYLDDDCHCRPLDADMIEDIVWASITKLLTDPRALARCHPGDRLTLIGSEPTLDELIDLAHQRVAESEGALAHAAVELVHARLPGETIAAATQELQISLEAAVTNRDKLLQRRRDATDVERLNRLRLDADIIAAHLNHLTPPQRRAVLDMLAAKVTVMAWTICPLCRGNGKQRGGRAGHRCHACMGGRQLPEINVICWWAEDAYEALRRTEPLWPGSECGSTGRVG